MQFRALLYEKNKLAAETEFLAWTKEMAPVSGVACIEVADIFEKTKHPGEKAGERLQTYKERLRALLLNRGIDALDCLYIVTTTEAWDLAKALGIAALPYVAGHDCGNAGMECTEGECADTKSNAPTAPQFPGAWIVAEGLLDADYDFFNKCYLRAHNLPWVILTTERCYVRELTLADMDALFALYEQDGVTDYMEGLYERDEEERYEQAYIENMYRFYGYGMWLVCKKDTGEIIGRAGLEHRDYHGTTELEMGYLIAPSEQRKGYAAEICGAILHYAKENLDFSRVNCLISADNHVSVHLAKRLGFTFYEKLNMDGTEMERYMYCFLKENPL